MTAPVDEKKPRRARKPVVTTVADAALAERTSAPSVFVELPPSASPLRFVINPIEGNTLTGFCWNPERPDQRYEVQACSEGILVAYGQANQEIAQSKSAGLSHTDTGFRLSLPALLHDGLRHVLTFRVVHKSPEEPSFEMPDQIVFESANVVVPDARIQMLPSMYEESLQYRALAESVEQPSRRYAFNHVAPKLSLHMHCLELPESKALLDFATKASAQHPYFICKAAELLLLKGQWKKAADLFALVLRQVPASVAASAGIAHALEKQGLSDKAKEALKLAMKSDPRNLRVRTLLLKMEGKARLSSANAKTDWAALERYFMDLWPQVQGDCEFEDLMIAIADRRATTVDADDSSGAAVAELTEIRRVRRLLEFAMQS